MQLKKILDKFYRDYDFEKRKGSDPIEFPRRYPREEDAEAAGFLASCFAYGRVGLFMPVVERLLSPMGKSPHDFLLHFDPLRDRRAFQGIKYRFNENGDILSLLHVLAETLKKYGTLETAFLRFFDRGDENIGTALTRLVGEFLSIDTAKVYGENLRPAGFRQFFPSPAGGSSCKRANLFLRWMVRDRDIDLGIWKGVPKDRLVIPLDTHIARISRCLGLTVRKTQDWKTAVEITKALKLFDPEDPLKYDFALCHHGISGMCKGMRDREGCNDCIFNLGFHPSS